MRLAYTHVCVRDAAASLQGYLRAFGRPARIALPEGSSGEVEVGATAPAFVEHATAGAIRAGHPGHHAAAGRQTGVSIGLPVGVCT